MTLSSEELIETCFELLSSHQKIDDNRFADFVDTISKKIKAALSKTHPELSDQELDENVKKLKKSVCYWQIACQGYGGA